MASSPHARAFPALAGAPWLARRDTRSLLAMLGAAGHEARVVGGAVRNALLGAPVGDIDIATTASPEAVIAAAARAGLATVPTGIAHGTVTVVVDGRPFEVTTLRRDVATDGRRAVVAFTDDWAHDAARRDFTMNALYCDADGVVHDPLGGLDDLVARRVRFIGDADQRIREDYLRILRYFRFNAEYGAGNPEPAGIAACVRQRAGLASLSGERIRRELVGIVAAPGGAPAIRAACESGILTALFGIAPHPLLLERLIAIEAGLGAAADPVLRIAVLAASTPEDAARIDARLKLSTQERDRLIDAAVHRPMAAARDGEAAARRALYAAGSARRFEAQVRGAWARSADPVADPRWARLHALPGRWPRPDFPLRGADALALGVAPGPAVGALLARLEGWWVDNGFPSDRRVLLDRLAAEASVISST